MHNRLKASLQDWGIVRVTDVQRMALEAGVADGKSLVVCAPTSSGKTLIGEIALLQALRNGHQCLYLVSHKALAAQKYSDFISRFSGKNAWPTPTIGLSTGDREEGNLQADILVATYEKGLVLVFTGQINPKHSVVVADELQIIGDPARGPSIETLCAILRQRDVTQFLALTATIDNPRDIADWMRCELVQCHNRDVDLQQEIWYRGHCNSVTFGQEIGETVDAMAGCPEGTLEAVDYLLDHERAPILVFTESRREASQYANVFCRRRQKHASGIGLAEQLELFSEPTEGSESLQKSAERRIAIHTADLTPQEREVIEQGFLDTQFDVCFATSTLAAGVNFPFKTVVFTKLTYEYGDRQGTHITRADYRNMSGRAGRLGMHDLGYAVLIPKNTPELNHANAVVLPENDRIFSQLPKLTMRRAILTLVAAGVIRSKQAIRDFLENTYYWHLTLERNPAKLEIILARLEHSLGWLVESDFIQQQEETYFVTPFGNATARSGLLPSTAREFVSILAQYSENFEANFDDFICGLIHWICCCDEFKGENPSRFLPYPIGGQALGSTTYLARKQLLQPLDRTDYQLNQNVHALSLFIEGIAERFISHQTKISSGSVHRLANDVSWVLDGLCTITTVPDLTCPQQISNKLRLLARRVRRGAPTEALDLINLAEYARVPGFGRQRAMALINAGIQSFEDVENLGAQHLAEIIGSLKRAEALLAAIGEQTEFSENRFSSVHAKLADQLGISETVSACAKSLGTDYEDAIVNLLKCEPAWVVTVRDNGKRQNEPDVLLRLNDMAVLLEIKTATRKSGLINKEAAFAVLQKAQDYEKNIARVTLGKHRFDEMSRVKITASSDLTLVEHVVFIEAVLRVLLKEIKPEEFLKWLIEPGEAEFERIPGKPTNLLT